MPAGTHSNEPDIDPVMAAAVIGGLFGLCLVLLVAVEWPVFVWSLIHARPMLLEPTDAIGGGLHNVFAHDHFGVPRAWRHVAPLLPPKAAWIALDVAGLLMVLVAAASVWFRVEVWSGRSTLSLPSWDLRKQDQAAGVGQAAPLAAPATAVVVALRPDPACNEPGAAFAAR